MKQKFCELAKKLSYKSDYEDRQHGAVVAKRGKLLGIGFNKRRSHPASNARFNNMHAEFSAILNCNNEDLSNCDIYIYRENKEGSLAMSKPCEFCSKMIKQIGIKNIYYT